MTSSLFRRDALASRLSLIVIGVCGLTVTVTALALALPALKAGLTGTAVQPGYAAGDTLDPQLQELGNARRRIFLFSRSSCKACQASKPVMATMVAELKRFRDVAVLVVTPLADVEAEIDFAADIGVNRSGVLPTTMSELRLRYVPGVVVADADGRVLFAKEGLLTEEDRLHVIRIASQ
jgi:hypothetical protein